MRDKERDILAWNCLAGVIVTFGQNSYIITSYHRYIIASYHRYIITSYYLYITQLLKGMYAKVILLK